MNDNKFKTYMMVATSKESDYSSGYQRGLRRFHHGEVFGTPTEHEHEHEHEQWLSLSGHRQELGDGYRDGYKGNPPKGYHGNIGNLNAQGDLPADSQIQLRINSQIKAQYVKQAQKENLKLSQWVIKTLSAAVH